MLVEQIDDSYDSHNSLQYLARDFIDSQGNNHADFPNLPVDPALSPALKKGLRYGKDRHEQNKGKSL